MAKLKSLSLIPCFKPTSKNQNLEDFVDLELGTPKKGYGEDGLDSELIKLHNLCGPPRFLFTIVEETEKDLLESDDGRLKLGDLFTVESPVLTPVGSPNVCDKIWLKLDSEDLDSPPPTFKFLKDAEEKYKRKMLDEEGEKRREKQLYSVGKKEYLPLGPSPLSIELSLLKGIGY